MCDASDEPLPTRGGGYYGCAPAAKTGVVLSPSAKATASRPPRTNGAKAGVASASVRVIGDAAPPVRAAAARAACSRAPTARTISAKSRRLATTRRR